MYIAFYFVPLLIMFSKPKIDQTKLEDNICMYVSLASSIFLFIYEVIQMRAEAAEYFTDFWNWVDMVGFGSFWLLCLGILKYDVFLRVMIVTQMLFKVNFYLRIYDQFGLLVNLVSTCLVDVIPFFTYLVIWQIIFVMLYV